LQHKGDRLLLLNKKVNGWSKILTTSLSKMLFVLEKHKNFGGLSPFLSYGIELALYFVSWKEN